MYALTFKEIFDEAKISEGQAIGLFQKHANNYLRTELERAQRKYKAFATIQEFVDVYIYMCIYMCVCRDAHTCTS